MSKRKVKFFGDRVVSDQTNLNCVLWVSRVFFSLLPTLWDVCFLMQSFWFKREDLGWSSSFVWDDTWASWVWRGESSWRCFGELGSLVEVQLLHKLLWAWWGEGVMAHNTCDFCNFGLMWTMFFLMFSFLDAQWVWCVFS